MSFQIHLKNQLTGGKDLKMCDPTDDGICTTPISYGGSYVTFPQQPDSLESVKVSPTVGGQPMEGDWMIVLEENFDEYKFSNGGASVREILHRRRTGQLVIRLSGGTTDWELLIYKPAEVSEKKQPTNVTIGDD